MTRYRGLALLAMAAVLAGTSVGCQRTLFSDSEGRSRSSIDRYYGGDSAVETRASRVKASEMGFGFPTGMANQ